MANDSQQVSIQFTGALATITLDRPSKLNALSASMASELASCFHDVASSSSVRCVLLRGAGRAFCTGADIAEFASSRANRADGEKFAAHFHTALNAVSSCPLPVVAVIRGACVGGGLQLACLCDLRIASENARFGIPVNRLGLTVDYEELLAIHEVVGETNLLQLLLEGRISSAAEARAMSLVTRVVPDDRLDLEAQITAERIADGAPLVNRWHKRFIRRLRNHAPLTREEIAESFDCFETRDYQIGYEAFLQKTKPMWEGR